jgi:hypothetical protein
MFDACKSTDFEHLGNRFAHAPSWVLFETVRICELAPIAIDELPSTSLF